MIDLKISPGVEADGSVNTKTPGKKSSKSDVMSRLSKVRRSLIFILVLCNGMILVYIYIFFLMCIFS